MPKDTGYVKSSAPLEELERACEERLADARSLLDAGRFVGAICNAIYALEIQLKVKVCNTLDVDALPSPFKIHDLQGLLVLSGLSRRINMEEHLAVKANWDAVVNESKSLDTLRYSGGKAWGPVEAKEFLAKIIDPPHGVLLWISVQT